MPYGLKNTPAIFQSFVDKILKDLHGQGVVVYIDDILIYSATRTVHVSLVGKVLGRLLEHDLYVLAEKRFLPGVSHFHPGGSDGV
jgi:hypothetical protein